MSYRVITICIENVSNTAKLVDMAARLAGTAPTYIKMVHVMPGGFDALAASPYILATPLTELHDRYERTAKLIKETYDACQNKYGDNISWDWHQTDVTTVGDFSAYVDFAIASDLVILAQPPNAGWANAMSKTLVTESGVPVLVLSDEFVSDAPIERIGIAWNNTPEAARAVRDALPILKLAELVVVINITSNNKTLRTNDIDIGRYLGAHGIQIEIDHFTLKDNVASDLLKHIDDSYLDLLVMGGFGHSSLYNLVLGAATPNVLKSTSIPVLMSH
jgi:nucleotide-binding universal stress UspA family protein